MLKSCEHIHETLVFFFILTKWNCMLFHFCSSTNFKLCLERKQLVLITHENRIIGTSSWEVSETEITETSLLALQHERVSLSKFGCWSKFRQTIEVFFYTLISGFRAPSPFSQAIKDRKMVCAENTFLKEDWCYSYGQVSAVLTISINLKFR